MASFSHPGRSRGGSRGLWVGAVFFVGALGYAIALIAWKGWLA